MEKRQGALYFDREGERYNIRFGLEECYHGLYCGEGLEVLVGKRWVRTWIEKAPVIGRNRPVAAARNQMA